MTVNQVFHHLIENTGKIQLKIKFFGPYIKKTFRTYLRPCKRSMMELFGGNSEQLLV